MADVITRLKVDSQEYDSKLKNAVSQMNAMEQQVRRTGASFAYADKEELAFVKSLGDMNTAASSAKTKLREYTDAITSLTASYRQLSDEEKSSEFGIAMASSIDKLKIKAAQLKDVMSDTNREIQNLSSDTAFTDGMNMMTRTVGACAAAVVTWTGGGKEMEKVIKDLAKITATVAAVEQLTKAFQKQNLVLLKNPYVLAATAAAALAVALVKVIKASQELSAVEKALNDVQEAGRNNAAQEITRIDTLNNILHDNTRSLEERKAALTEIQNLVPEYHGALTEEGNLINDNTGAIDSYIESLKRAAIAQAAFDRMVELQKQKMQQQIELEKAMRRLEGAQASAATPAAPVAGPGAGAVSYAGANAAARQAEVNAAKAEVQSIQQIVNDTDEQIKALEQLVKVGDLGTGTGTTTTKKTVSKTSTAKASTGTGFSWNAPGGMPEAGSLDDLEMQAAMVRNSMGGATTTEEYQQMEMHLNSIIAKMKELRGEKEVTFEAGSLNDLNQKLREAQDILANLAPDTEAWAEALENVVKAQEAVNDLQTKMGNNTAAKTQAADANTMGSAFSSAAGLIGQVGGALRKIEDPSAKIAGMIAEAIASVAAGLGEMLAQPGATSEAWGWIALAISGTATMISTIASIKAATQGYANGGMVGGNSYSGDNIVARLNSGEGVLTATGVRNAAQMAANASNSLGGFEIVGELHGETIRMALVNNNLRRGGSRSEYAIIG